MMFRKFFSDLWLNIRVGFFLAVRQIRRSSPWTTVLIVFVMFLTFLNLVAVTGVLVGLIEGINEQYRIQYIGDVMVSPLDNKSYIEHSPDVLALLYSLPQVETLSTRYIAGANIEANYLSRNDSEKPNATGAQVIGIDPVAENKLGGLASHVIEGQYLSPNDYDSILIGDLLLAKYAFGQQPGLTPLKDVVPGTLVRVTINGNVRDMTVKGIVKSKVDLLATSIFMPAEEVRQLANREDYNLSQIAIRLKPGVDPAAFSAMVKQNGVSQNAKVQTFIESIPNGVADITNTFAMLGNMISSIGLVVASTTVFIVIFINALTRRKFIGILKGIGI